MLRKTLALAVVAAAVGSPAAYAIRDCDTSPCWCGSEIAVGLPDKDPIVRLGRIDC